MSYEKVRNINYKTREITSASNNTYVWNGNKYVHDYITWKYGVDSWSEKEFISNLLMDISDGNLQCGSKYKKLYILIDKANIKELDDIRWNWDKSIPMMKDIEQKQNLKIGFTIHIKIIDLLKVNILFSRVIISLFIKLQKQNVFSVTRTKQKFMIH